METFARPYLEDLISTTTPYDRLACIKAVEAAATLYRKLRTQLASASFTPRLEAEAAAMAYLGEIEGRIRLIERAN
ncbi:MAG: hypothetical protein FJ147_09680 [Deltaproteobacteria bacterium]|nr:hypothetical protein [Deltaproteobacteria bacterium]